MSYEVVKRITLNEKKNKITITSDSNNVYPKTFRAWELKRNNEDASFETKLRWVMEGILSGDLQFRALNDNTCRFIVADYKMRDYLKANHLDDFEMYCNKEQYKKEYDDLFEIFKACVLDDDKKSYIIKVNSYSNYCYVGNKGRFNRGYLQKLYCETKNNAMKFNKFYAEIIKRQYGKSYNVEIELAEA